MNLFYKPLYGVVGDTIPYYHKGRYHIFFLRQYRDQDSHGRGSPWHHVSTKDFLTFEDHGEAIWQEDIDKHDEMPATCVCGRTKLGNIIYFILESTEILSPKINTVKLLCMP